VCVIPGKGAQKKKLVQILKLPNQLTNLTPWSRILLEKQVVTQLVDKYPATYGCLEVH